MQHYTYEKLNSKANLVPVQLSDLKTGDLVLIALIKFSDCNDYNYNHSGIVLYTDSDKIKILLMENLNASTIGSNKDIHAGAVRITPTFMFDSHNPRQARSDIFLIM